MGGSDTIFPIRNKKNELFHLYIVYYREGQNHMLRILLYCILIISCIFSSLIAQEKENIEDLFQKAVILSGEEYIKVRQTLLERTNKVNPFLKRVKETSKDWRALVIADIIQGWIDNPNLYKEFWNWKAPSNGYRNPYPRMRQAARAKFSEAGEKITPLMLELIWKKGETHYGALPLLLAKWEIEISIPVLVDLLSVRRSAYILGKAVGSFGTKATPLVLKALKNVDPPYRSGLIVALGLTGDKKAVPELLWRLREEHFTDSRCTAAYSLGLLKKFALLKKEILAIKNKEVRIAVLKALEGDQSGETRQFLRKFTTTANDKEERITAFKVILKNGNTGYIMEGVMPSDKGIRTACEIASRESDNRVQCDMYSLLGAYFNHIGKEFIREALLIALDNKAKEVQCTAINGLKYFYDEEVTNALLTFIKLGEDEACRKEALRALKYRQSPAIAGAVIPLLTDKDLQVQQFAIQALRKNPTEKALSPLADFLNTPNDCIRSEALRALAEIGGERVLVILQKAEKQETNEHFKKLIQKLIQGLPKQKKDK